MSLRSNSPLAPFVPLSLDARRDAPYVVPRRRDTCARPTFAPLSSSQRGTRDRPLDRVSRLFPSIYWRKCGGKYSKICTAEVHNVRYEIEYLSPSLHLLSSLPSVNCLPSRLHQESRPLVSSYFPYNEFRINLTRHAPRISSASRALLQVSREKMSERSEPIKLGTKEDRELLPLSRMAAEAREKTRNLA